MTNEKREWLSDRHLSMFGFFGATSVTALVLVLSFPKTFLVQVWIISPHWYFAILVILLALISSSCIFANLGLISVIGGRPDPPLERFVYTSMTISVFGLLIVLPMILLPFTFAYLSRAVSNLTKSRSFLSAT
jgi:hypothetical protein